MLAMDSQPTTLAPPPVSDPTPPREPPELAARLRAIPTASRQELIDLWIAAYGQPPPKGLSRRLLEYAAAYHLQIQVYGGLSKATERALARALNPKAKPTRKRLSPGTRLVREWRGRTHIVEVQEKGFTWNGKAYRSLTEIAHAITGAHWSGPRFFGL
jgi:hypothetical protein